jgi:hypothetical protein
MHTLLKRLSKGCECDTLLEVRFVFEGLCKNFALLKRLEKHINYVVECAGDGLEEKRRRVRFCGTGHVLRA